MTLRAPPGRQLHRSVAAGPAATGNPGRPTSMPAKWAAVIASRADTRDGGPPVELSAVPPVTPFEVGQAPDPAASAQPAKGGVLVPDAPQTTRPSPECSHPGSGLPDPHVHPLSRNCTAMQHPRRRRPRGLPEVRRRVTRNTGGAPRETCDGARRESSLHSGHGRPKRRTS